MSITLNRSPVNMNSPFAKRRSPKKRIICIGRVAENIIAKNAIEASKSISPNILTKTIKILLKT